MASNIRLSTTFTNNLLEHSGVSLVDQLSLGTVKVYASGGSPPAGPNETATGTLLATFTFATAASWGAPSAGVQNLDIPTATVTAAASGTADYFFICNSSAVPLIMGTVGTSASDFNLSSTTVTSGDNVTITGTPSISWTVT